MRLRYQSALWCRVVRPLGRQLFRVAENNEEPSFSHNGEGWLLRQLLAAHVQVEAGRSLVVFDGGTNAGDYTREVLGSARQAGCRVTVHAFEPSPHCVEALRRDFRGEPAVPIIAAAFADRVGEASLYDGRAGSSQASLVPREIQSGDAAATITVPLLRLADYLEREAVGHVELLKLDVEGSELAALRGLGDRLRPEVIDVIQFEYGGTTMDGGVTLRDLDELLTARGYVLAKLFPGALERRDYRSWMEHYAFANYVALSPRWCPKGE